MVGATLLWEWTQNSLCYGTSTTKSQVVDLEDSHYHASWYIGFTECAWRVVWNSIRSLLNDGLGHHCHHVVLV